MYETDKILTDREVSAYKTILSVSKDPEVKKVLSERLSRHEEQVLIRDAYRNSKKVVIKWLKKRST